MVVKINKYSLPFLAILITFFLSFETHAAKHRLKNQVSLYDASLLESLNTLTFVPLSSLEQELKITAPSISISELVYTIDKDFETLIDPLIIPIKNKNKEPKNYCKVSKGVDLPSNQSKYVTVVSKSYAEGVPIGIKQKKSFMQKIGDYLLPDYKDLADLPVHGGAALVSYAAYRDNLIYTPCINFDYPDKELTNFAQTIDLYCLKNIIEKIPQNSKAIFIGTYRGATNLLKNELLNQTLHRPVSMILESPFFSIKDVSKQISLKCRIKFPFLANLAYKSFCWLHPNFNPLEDNLEELLTHNKISETTSILLIHLKDDPMVSDAAMFTIAKLLSSHNTNIHLLILEDSTKTFRHGQLQRSEKCQQVVNSFYRYYNLPHDNALATAGEHIFSTTKSNVYQCNSPQEWQIISCFDKAQ